MLKVVCECLILAHHADVMCEQSVHNIVRLPILHCNPLQPKGFVPVLVLLRMAASDSDIHSRRPLFWVPVEVKLWHSTSETQPVVENCQLAACFQD